MIRTTLAEQENRIERRKAELGIVGRSYVTPNSGRRRTSEKRELLRRMERDRQARGLALAFQAAY